MLEIILKILISYCLGSIMGAMVMGKFYGGIDIRSMGSGNAGGTNALRTQGVWFALGVIVIDIGKGILAAGFIPNVNFPFFDGISEQSDLWLVVFCASASVIGHVWPLYHHGRGGKGAATLIGTLIIIAPFLLLPVLVVWFFVLFLSGFVGLATIFAAASAPTIIALQGIDDLALFVYCVVMAFYLLFSHRSNIRRMRLGNVNRLDIFKRKE